ncbi:MAG TPA: PAS domain-containing protein [Mucilaginibacter sp.]|nr:PAS domain-containing protein [Mucilaginibacter sp.]
MAYTEDDRIKEVQKYLRLDLTRSTELQDIVDLAAQLCDKPIAFINLLDEQANLLKVRSGMDLQFFEESMEPSATGFSAPTFCHYGMQQNDVLVINNALNDSRFDDDPMVHSGPKVRFYAGAPLIINNGLKLGTLCLFDSKPGELSDVQKKALRTLSRQIAHLLELELAKELLKRQVQETNAKNESLMKIAYIQSHEIRHPLTSIMGLINLIRDDAYLVNGKWLKMMTDAAENLDARITAIVNESLSDKDLKAIRFDKMVEEIEDYAILLLDQHGNIENWNKGAMLVKGYQAGEIIGKNFRIFYTDDDRKGGRPERLIAHAIAHGTAKDQGWRVRKDGTRFWGSIVITAIHNDKNEVIGFTKVTKDLTGQMEHPAVAGK